MLFPSLNINSQIGLNSTFSIPFNIELVVTIIFLTFKSVIDLLITVLFASVPLEVKKSSEGEQFKSWAIDFLPFSILDLVSLPKECIEEGCGESFRSG